MPLLSREGQSCMKTASQPGQEQRQEGVVVSREAGQGKGQQRSQRLYLRHDANHGIGIQLVTTNIAWRLYCHMLSLDT